MTQNLKTIKPNNDLYQTFKDAQEILQATRQQTYCQSFAAELEAPYGVGRRQHGKARHT